MFEARSVKKFFFWKVCVMSTRQCTVTGHPGTHVVKKQGKKNIRVLLTGGSASGNLFPLDQVQILEPAPPTPPAAGEAAAPAEAAPAPAVEATPVAPAPAANEAAPTHV